MSIAPYQQNGAEVAVPQSPQVSAVAALTEWAHGAQAAHEVAVNLVNTSFCPKHYQGKPHEATAAILAGLEVGLQPMAALQSFHSIQGVAAPKAITLRAIVQSHGHALDIVESSATRVVAVGRRAGSSVTQTSTWTIERAQTMGLPGKNPNWKSQPEAMLIARATAECARLVAADAILGIPYAVEELEDGPVRAVAEQVAPPASAAPGRRRNVASVLPPAAAEKPVEAPSPGRLDPNGVERKRVDELLMERVSTDLSEVMEWVSAAVDRPVRHPKELSLTEARDLIGRLERLPVKAETNEESA